MQENEQIMTLREIADYLRLKERTIYKWAQEGRIPAVKLGSIWRFRKSEVDEWMERNRNTSAEGVSGTGGSE